IWKPDTARMSAVGGRLDLADIDVSPAAQRQRLADGRRDRGRRHWPPLFLRQQRDLGRAPFLDVSLKRYDGFFPCPSGEHATAGVYRPFRWCSGVATGSASTAVSTAGHQPVQQRQSGDERQKFDDVSSGFEGSGLRRGSKRRDRIALGREPI